MLLTHTSGEGIDVISGTRGDWTDADKAEGIRRALTTPLQSAPGEVFRYSDINYILLGALIEQLTGEAEDVYVEQQCLCAAWHERNPLPSSGQSLWATHAQRSRDWMGSRAARARAGRLSCRYLEHQSVIAHRTNGTRRGKQN